MASLRPISGKLELINFRSHSRSQINFDGRPLAITGKNGAGKTNILEAFSLFSPGRGLRRAERDMIARQPENLGWKTAINISDDDQFEIVNNARIGEARQVVINDKTATQSAMGEYLRLVWMTPAQDRIWIDSASDRRRFFDRIVLSFFPDHGEAVLKFEKNMRERNRLFKEKMDDPHWCASLEANMAEAAERIVSNRADTIARLNREMENRDSVFPKGKLSLDYDGDYALDHDWARFWEGERQTDRYAGTTRLGPHRVNFDAEFLAKAQRAALCSTGEQKALLISLFLANARALISSDARVFVLLDEVAAHLDETRRKALFDELCALPAQIVMTGTEAELFQELGERGKYLYVAEEEGISLVSEIEIS